VGKDIAVRCARCEIKECRDGWDSFSKSDSLKLCDGTGIAGLHKAPSAIEARHYGKQTRLGEATKLTEELGCSKVGLAFCIGLSEEATIIDA